MPTKKILIVEDDDFLQSILKRKISEANYETLSASDGKMGLKMAEKNKPDLILLDLILPEMDGLQVLEKIKLNPDRAIRKIPVLMLTNIDRDGASNKARKLGVSDYLLKSEITIDSIIQKIEKMLNKI